MTDIERLPPFNKFAEEAVLGSLIIDPDAIVRVAAILKPESFYRAEHQVIFDVVHTLYKKGVAIDFLTVCDELERRELLEFVGGAAFITSLNNAVPTSIHAEHYAHIVDDMALRRNLIDAADKAAKIVFREDLPPQEIHALLLQTMVDAAPTTKNQGTELKDLASTYFDMICASQEKGKPPGVPTGFQDLDVLLSGLQKSDLILLAARPSTGKSALAANIAANVASKFYGRVAFFSLEMSNEQVVQRLVSAESGIDSMRLRQCQIGDQWNTFGIAVDKLTRWNIHIDDTPGLTPEELRSKLMLLDAQEPLDLAIVDYLQIMKTSQRTKDRYHAITEISQSLKAIAKDLNIPLLVLSQLSRECEQRMNKRPILSDLRDSGAIEQDSDVVMFIYRDEMYNENTERANIADVIVAKHRNGPTGTVSLYFKKETTEFRDAILRNTEIDDWVERL